VAEHREDRRPDVLGQAGQDVVAHRGDLALDGLAALDDPRVGRGQGPHERHAQLGLVLHRLAGPPQHVGHLLRRRGAPRRRLGHPRLQPARPLRHRGGQQVVLRREVAVDGGEGHVGGDGHVAHLHRVVAALRAEHERGVDEPTAPVLLLERQLAHLGGHQAAW
jgi:hypothetical protein